MEKQKSCTILKSWTQEIQVHTGTDTSLDQHCETFKSSSVKLLVCKTTEMLIWQNVYNFGMNDRRQDISLELLLIFTFAFLECPLFYTEKVATQLN